MGYHRQGGGQKPVNINQSAANYFGLSDGSAFAYGIRGDESMGDYIFRTEMFDGQGDIRNKGPEKGQFSQYYDKVLDNKWDTLDTRVKAQMDMGRLTPEENTWIANNRGGGDWLSNAGDKTTGAFNTLDHGGNTLSDVLSGDADWKDAINLIDPFTSHLTNFIEEDMGDSEIGKFWDANVAQPAEDLWNENIAEPWEEITDTLTESPIPGETGDGYDGDGYDGDGSGDGSGDVPGDDSGDGSDEIDPEMMAKWEAVIDRYLGGDYDIPEWMQQETADQWGVFRESLSRRGISIDGDDPESAVASSTSGARQIGEFNRSTNQRYDQYGLGMLNTASQNYNQLYGIDTQADLTNRGIDVNAGLTKRGQDINWDAMEAGYTAKSQSDLWELGGTTIGTLLPLLFSWT